MKKRILVVFQHALLSLVLVSCNNVLRTISEEPSAAPAQDQTAISHKDSTLSLPSFSTLNSENATLITLQAKNSLGENITTGGADVQFSHSGGTSTGTFSPTVDNQDGTYTTMFTAKTAGTKTTIYASINSILISGLPEVVVNPGTISMATSSIEVVSNNSGPQTVATITLQAKDINGNNLTTGGETVVFALAGGTSDGVLSTITDNGDGTYTATFTGTTAGAAKVVNAQINGLAVSSPSPSVIVTKGVYTLSESILTVSQSSAEIGSPTTVTLQLKDSNNNNITVGGETVTFSYSGGLTGSFSTVVDNNDGSYSASFTGTTAGTATLAATIAGESLTSALPTVTVVPGSYTTRDSVLTASSETINAGETLNLNLQLKDSNGNNITTGGETVAFSYSGGTSTGTLSDVIDNNDGSYTATFTGSIAGTTITFAATIDGESLTSTLPTVTVEADGCNLASSTIVNGSGTALDPYLVCNRSQLENVRNLDASGVFFKLTNSIDMSSSNYTPDPLFNGTFDGNNLSLFSLSAIRTNGAAYWGGFAEKINGAVVKNLNLEDVTVTSNGDYVGGLSGEINNSTIQNCSLSGSVQGRTVVGGLFAVTVLGGTYLIEDNTINLTSLKVDRYGGFLAGAAEGAIQRNITSGTMSFISGATQKKYLGGFIGSMRSGTLDQNKVSGTMNLSNNGGYIGGFLGVGTYDGNVTISNCYTEVIINANPGAGRIGGFIGDMWNGYTINISNSYASGSLSTNTSSQGAIIGYQSSGTVNATDFFWLSGSYPTASAGSGGGTPNMLGDTGAKTLVELQTASTFSPWDDASIWNIADDINPTLKIE